MNLSLALESRVERTPDAIAIEDGDACLTFAALAGRARRGAACLLAAAPPGDGAVALLMPGDARFVEWFLAIAHTGRPVLPVNARLTAREIASQLADADIRFLLGDAGDVRLESIRSQVPGLMAMPAPELDGLPLPMSRLPGGNAASDATLAVLMTSGTSGRSKERA